jgi:uncharacterized membrane protein
MEKFAEIDLTHLYLRHVVIVVTVVTTISLPSVNFKIKKNFISSRYQELLSHKVDLYDFVVCVCSWYHIWSRYQENSRQKFKEDNRQLTASDIYKMYIQSNLY